MALSSELREALARRSQPRLRCRAQQLPDSEGDECYGISHIDERLLDSNKTASQEQSCALSALPPPSPDWSHLLGGRPHEAASALDGTMALLALGCRLGIHPTPDMLPAGCRVP
jgi:hypothetical protein